MKKIHKKLGYSLNCKFELSHMFDFPQDQSMDAGHMIELQDEKFDLIIDKASLIHCFGTMVEWDSIKLDIISRHPCVHPKSVLANSHLHFHQLTKPFESHTEKHKMRTRGRRNSILPQFECTRQSANNVLDISDD